MMSPIPDDRRSFATAMPAAPAPLIATWVFSRLDPRSRERVEERGGYDDCRSMLVIVEDRHIQSFLEFRFDVETARRSDVFEVDAAERRRNVRDDIDDLVRIAFGNADRERLDTSQRLEQDRFALHHRQCCFGADIAESEDGRSIGHDRDQIVLDRQFVHAHRVVTNLDSRCQRGGWDIQDVQDVVVLDRDLRTDFEHATMPAPQREHFFAQRFWLLARSR